MSNKKVSPKAITALIMEKSSDEKTSDFVKEACVRVFEKPALLSDEWIKRINRWAEDTVDSMSLDEETSTAKKGDNIKRLGPLKVVKKIKRYSKSKKYWGEKFMDFIAEDEHGWKFWFRVHIATRDLKKGLKTFPRKGSYVVLKNVRVNENQTGITFLRFTNDVIELTDKEIANLK